MADLLSQKEIDDLLNSSISDEASDSADESGSGTQEKRSSSRMKTFSFKKNKNIRFAFPYQSPVLKRNNFVYDPEPTVEETDEVHIVRSVENYVEYVKSKRVGA